VPTACGGTGFQPVRLHRQDAGATKTFLGKKNAGWALPTLFFCAYTAKGIMRRKPGRNGE
jgi:hypothetical protein